MELLGRALQLEQVEPEARALREALADRVVDLALGTVELRVCRRRPGEPDVLAEVEGDLAVAAAQRPGADPDELAAGAELVQPGRAVGAEPAGQHVALPGLRGQRDPLERDQRLAQPVGPAPERPWASTFCQLGRKRASSRWSVASTSWRSRARLARRSRRRTSASHHSRAGSAGQQLAADHVARSLQLLQGGARVDAVAVRQLPGRERHVCRGVAPDQGDEGVLDRLQEALRQAGRRRHPEGVAVEARVLGGDVALLTGDPHHGRAALLDQLLEHRRGRVALLGSLLALLGGQVAEPAEDLLQAVAVLGQARLGQVLELPATSSSASGSISSRSSSWPSSSASRSRSSASAAARRSAFGVSPSYM